MPSIQMPYTYEQSRLWKTTLAPFAGDEHAAPRETLRQAFIDMRENAAHLVAQIPADCRGLTVHDVTHLDALWEMADLIGGPNWMLTPAEAFVFGAAVLIHDSGMSVASYPGGLDEIRATTEWSDISHAILRQRGIPEPDTSVVRSPPPEFYSEILFSVLRELHAKHAEELVSVEWKLPGGAGTAMLLNKPPLRTAYGKRIGRIANSHHWDIEKVATTLAQHVGAATDLPAAWTVNEIKVACLLRCADAAHIDHRRAPTMLYALTRPSGVSAKHWNFQNKLNKPSLDGDALVYSSGQQFGVEDADAWWLAYDAIKLIDKEISSSNSLLEDIGQAPFTVKRVLGADSPRILAKNVIPHDWKPVDAEIRVSDPVNLAQTLGGRNLYGHGLLAPIRELLQNAVDAVRARRKHQSRDRLWGRIRITIEPGKIGSESGEWMHFDDEGIGMSERILVGPLLDFGRSFWNSALLREEFPGLESKGIQPIGKYGIGFFSIFLLGQHVKVVSRKYTSGDEDARALEFSSLATRPIIRQASPNEIPTDFTTRVSVFIPNLTKLLEFERQEFLADDFYHRRMYRRPSVSWPDMVSRVLQLMASLDVHVELTDTVRGIQFVHKPDWLGSTPQDFLSELLAGAAKKDIEQAVRSYGPRLTHVLDSNGRVLGRAALRVTHTDLESGFDRNPRGGFISVGGFAVGADADFFVGVMFGKSDDATRRSGTSVVPQEAIARWASEQAKLLSDEHFQKVDLVIAAHTIHELGGDPGNLPFCYAGSAFLSRQELYAGISSLAEMHFPLHKSYSEKFDFVSLNDLRSIYFTLKMKPNVVVIDPKGTPTLVGEEIGREVQKSDSYELSKEHLDGNLDSSAIGLILPFITNAWDAAPKMYLRKHQLFSGTLLQTPAERWVLTLKRQGGS